MADWKKHYEDHLVTMNETARAIKPGDRVWLGQASQIPYVLLDEMHAHMTETEYDYHDIFLIHVHSFLRFHPFFTSRSNCRQSCATRLPGFRPTCETAWLTLV